MLNWANWKPAAISNICMLFELPWFQDSISLTQCQPETKSEPSTVILLFWWWIVKVQVWTELAIVCKFGDWLHTFWNHARLESWCQWLALTMLVIHWRRILTSFGSHGSSMKVLKRYWRLLWLLSRTIFSMTIHSCPSCHVIFGRILRCKQWCYGASSGY